MIISKVNPSIIFFGTRALILYNLGRLPDVFSFSLTLNWIESLVTGLFLSVYVVRILCELRL